MRMSAATAPPAMPAYRATFMEAAADRAAAPPTPPSPGSGLSGPGGSPQPRHPRRPLPPPRDPDPPRAQGASAWLGKAWPCGNVTSQAWGCSVG